VSRDETVEFIGASTKFLQRLFKKSSPLARDFHNTLKPVLERLATKPSTSSSESKDSNDSKENSNSTKEEERYIEALIALAMLYGEGSGGFVKDISVSFKYFLEAADSGHVTAQFTVALVYMKGLDVLMHNDIFKGIAHVELEEEAGASAHLLQESNENDENEEGSNGNTQFIRDEATGAIAYVGPSYKKKQLIKEQKQKQKAETMGPAQPPGVSLKNAAQKIKESMPLAMQYMEMAAKQNHAKAQLFVSFFTKEKNQTFLLISKNFLSNKF